MSADVPSDAPTETNPAIDEAVASALNGAGPESSGLPAQPNATSKQAVIDAIQHFAIEWQSANRFPNGGMQINPVDMAINVDLDALRYAALVDYLVDSGQIDQDAINYRFAALLEKATQALKERPRLELPRVMTAGAAGVPVPKKPA